MLEFVTESQNMPFTVSLVVMFGIALLEGVASLLGAGISSFLDTLIPEFDVDTDISMAAESGMGASEVPSVTPLSRLLGWLRVGKVPVLILLVVFLTGFGLVGLGIQSISLKTLGFLLPGLLVSAVAFAAALPVVRIMGGAIAWIIPQDETDAVSESSLVGRVAVITLGVAKTGSAAEAKVKDQHGLTHYVMVEPDSENDEYSSGTAVLLVKQQGSVYRVIKNTNPALVD